MHFFFSREWSYLFRHFQEEEEEKNVLKEDEECLKLLLLAAGVLMVETNRETHTICSSHSCIIFKYICKRAEKGARWRFIYVCIYLLGSPISFCLKAFCFCFVCCVIGFFYYRLGLSKCLRDKRFILTSAKCIHQLLFSAASSTFEQSNQSGRSHRVFFYFIFLFPLVSSVSF